MTDVWEKTKVMGGKFMKGYCFNHRGNPINHWGFLGEIQDGSFTSRMEKPTDIYMRRIQKKWINRMDK